MAANTTFGTATAITITTASLATDGNATSSAVDLSATNHIGVEFECVLIGAAGSTATLDVYMLPSCDSGTDYSTTDNADYVGSVSMNGTTEVVARLIAGNVSDNFKLYIDNQSGGALSSTEGDCTFFYRAISIADVT